MLACPTEDELLALANGFVVDQGARMLEAHLDACARCFAITELARSRRRSTEGDSPPAPAVMLEPGTRVGRYIIAEPLGRGAMGVVYAAHDPELERRIAIKMLRTPSPAMQARLRREAQAMARLSHPNIVAVHDVGLADTGVFIAMDYVDGVTLRHWLAEPRTPQAILDAFHQAGRGLAAAHRAGIVHRDFKPDNVLVDREGCARVTDFGLAFVERPDPPAGAGDAFATGGHALIGTPAYMAPEQVTGAAVVDARADVFAFAVSVWEALGGKLPFELIDIASRTRAIEAGKLAPSRDPIAPSIERALRRALIADPEARTSTIDELLLALQPRPRRSRGWIAGGLAVVTIATAGGVIVTRDHAPPAPREILRRRVITGEGGASVDLAALAPDGLRAAYGDHDGKTYVVTLASAHRQDLPFTGVSSFAWFGDELVAAMCVGNAPDCRLAITGTGGVRELGRVPPGSVVALGGKIAIVANDRIWIGALGQPVRVARTWPGVRFVAVAGAPDTAHLAAYDQNARRIHVVDASGIETSAVAIEGDGVMAGMAWLGEHRVLYAIDEDKLTGVYEITVDDAGLAGSPTKLHTFDIPVELFGASLDGRRVGYLRREQRTDSYVAPLRDDALGAPTRLTTAQLDAHVFGWLPDGSVLLTTTHDGGSSIVRASPDGGPATLIVDGERPVLAPDHMRLVFFRHERDRWTLHAISLAGGPVTDLFDLGELSHSMSPSIACPTTRCLLTYGGEDERHAFWFDLDRPALQPAPLEPGWTNKLSPTGKWYLASPDRHRLDLTDVVEHQRKELVTEACLFNRLEWAPDERSVLGSCMDLTASPSYLVRYDLATGSRTVIAKTPLAFTRIAISPDVRYLAYSVRNIGGALWIADGL